ncbi:hypothetical protein ACFYN0_26285 [Streptomyces sp. NPDC006704]|uniref:hypothetical protein n=1 Tax=Streptomyces sp. NPDC006704 TaxID=3364760 RepID=UPI0036A85DCE
MSNQDPRLDGVSGSLPSHPDYQRLVEATDQTVQWDIHVDGGTRAALGERYDMKAVDNLAMKRADETQGLWSTDRPRADEIQRQFIHVWAEGFMHGIVFVEQRKATALFGKLPDHNLVGATGSIIGGHWGDGENRSKEWAKRVDPETMVHVANVRSVQAIQQLQLDRPEPFKLRTAQAAHWADGFTMGFLFAELGGHREV